MAGANVKKTNCSSCTTRYETSRAEFVCVVCGRWQKQKKSIVQPRRAGQFMLMEFSYDSRCTLLKWNHPLLSIMSHKPSRELCRHLGRAPILSVHETVLVQLQIRVHQSACIKPVENGRQPAYGRRLLLVSHAGGRPHGEAVCSYFWSSPLTLSPRQPTLGTDQGEAML